MRSPVSASGGTPSGWSACTYWRAIDRRTVHSPPCQRLPTPPRSEIRDVNTRYHDLAAKSYDAKWGIDFGEIGQRQVGAKLRKALGGEPGPWEHALEIGAGTGYFSLNLMSEGLIERLTATDIAPGMLAALEANAERLGLEVEAVETDAEQLPFADETFDLVLGHAVLHHIPDLDRAASEFMRVLRPGGTVVFCGEPSRPRRPDRRLAEARRRRRRPRLAPRRSAPPSAVTPAAPTPTTATPSRPRSTSTPSTPRRLRAIFAGAGFEGVRIRGEELLANLYGWMLRTVESTAEPAEIPNALAPVRLPLLPRAAEGRHGPARAPPAAAALLQPRLLGARVAAARPLTAFGR